MIIFEVGNGTEINGIFKTDNSANVDAPALVIAKIGLLYNKKFFQKKK